MANRSRSSVSLGETLPFFAAALVIAVTAISSVPALAADAKVAGSLAVARNASLAAVSTDPVIQQVLEDDFHLAKRAVGDGGDQPVTITVTLTDRLLKPGLVLRDLGPGDPWLISNLLKQAGTEPPPLGDTGEQPNDPYEQSARRQALTPDDPMAQFRTYKEEQNAIRYGTGPKFGANGRATDEEIYDRAIVAHATAPQSTDELTAVLVVHPGDDLHKAKTLLAEEIANAVLH